MVATALGLEFRAVEGLLTDVIEQVHPVGSVYRVGSFTVPRGTVRVAVAQTGAGNTTAALETERAIQLFRPTYVLFVGVAGGIKDVELGDVVAGSKVYAYESGKASEQFLPRPELTMASHALLQRAMTVARDAKWQARISGAALVTTGHGPRAFVGPIAAGEKVLASTSSDIFAFVRRHYSDALAVEMEGYGSMRAAFAHAGVQSLVVRGISDCISGKSDADKKGWQDKAAHHAAAFAAEVISTLAAGDPTLTGLMTVAQAARNSHPGRSTIDSLPAQDLETTITSLLDLAPALYPTGPTDRDVWARAGGDISRLDLSPDGRTAWRRALGLLLKVAEARSLSSRWFRLCAMTFRTTWPLAASGVNRSGLGKETHR